LEFFLVGDHHAGREDCRLAGEAGYIIRVDVDISNAVVYLSGVVDSPEQKQRAEQRAREVSGVRDVVNSLQVMGQAPS
jgi:hypothetical protein